MDEFCPPPWCELLWQDPEVCMSCGALRVVQRFVFGDPAQKIIRVCQDHRMELHDEMYGTLGPQPIATGRKFSPNGLRFITEQEQWKMRSVGAFMIVDLTAPDTLGPSNRKMDEWRAMCASLKKCAIFLFSYQSGFQVMWHPAVQEMQNRRRHEWTKKEIELDAHCNRLYDQLRQLKPWQSLSETMSVDEATKMLRTPRISQKQAAMDFAHEVYRVECIIRDEDLLQVSLVMDT